MGVGGVAPHPAHPKIAVAKGEDEDAVLAAMQCPLLLLPAGDDPESTKTGGANQRVLTERGYECKVQEFPDMKHGFISRGDISNRIVARDVHLALQSSISFLNKGLVDVKEFYSGKVALVTGCSRGLGLGIV